MTNIRVLIVTKVFPTSTQPEAAPFNRHQFAALGKLCSVNVLGLVPWYPGSCWVDRWMGRPGAAFPPRRELVDGLNVRHPRVLYLPKVGQAVAGWTYALSLIREALRFRGAVDVVLGAFAYPDGWAALMIGRWLGVPVVVKVHGSDVNVSGEAPHLRGQVSRVLASAAAVVGPSDALVRRCVELGASPECATVIMNGVSGELFHPRNPGQCRRDLGRPPDRRVLLFVGRVEAAKGIFELLDAFESATRLHPDLDLVLVGDGVDRSKCEKRVAQQRLPVHFAGTCSQDQVALWMGAADLVTLPSWREGTPNVVIEALASGRRVVASAVGGIPAIVDQACLGELVPSRDSRALAEALTRALSTTYDPELVAQAAGFGDWMASAQSLYQVLAGAVRRYRADPFRLQKMARSPTTPK
jgi:glycosyltransferase involved in cell wall biosynthesis